MGHTRHLRMRTVRSVHQTGGEKNWVLRRLTCGVGRGRYKAGVLLLSRPPTNNRDREEGEEYRDQPLVHVHKVSLERTFAHAHRIYSKRGEQEI